MSIKEWSKSEVGGPREWGQLFIAVVRSSWAFGFETGSYHSLSCAGTCYADQACPKLAATAKVLGVKMYATIFEICLLSKRSPIHHPGWPFVTLAPCLPGAE